MKESGVGREGGRDSLDFFTEAQNICMKLSSHPALGHCLMFGPRARS